MTSAPRSASIWVHQGPASTRDRSNTLRWANAGLPILVSDNLEYQASLLKEGGFGWDAPLNELTSAVKRISEIDFTSFTDNARRYAATAVWEEDAKAFAEVYGSRR